MSNCLSANPLDRKSTRLNSSHVKISYAVFCLKKKKNHYRTSCNAKEQKVASYIDIFADGVAAVLCDAFVLLYATTCVQGKYVWFFVCIDAATTEIYTLSLHDALPI